MQLQEIVKGIKGGTTQLPDFQRGWIWDDDRIRRLIASISCSYPIGAVMFLEYGGDGMRFKSRTFTNVKGDGKKPEVLVLDGQQRLTSVYCAMCSLAPVPTWSGKRELIRRYYYLDIAKCVDPNIDRAEAVLSASANKTRQNRRCKSFLDLSTRQKEFREHMFPLNIVFNSIAVDEWRVEYRDYHKNAVYDNRMRVFMATVLNPIVTYTIPVIQLERTLPKEAVCQVFENVNTGGVQLTIFDLVTATFAAEDFFLREDWDKRQTAMIKAEGTFGILAAVSQTDFLVSLTVLSQYRSKKTLSVKRKEVLALTLENYKQNVGDLVEGYIKVARFLVEQGVYAAKDVPYTTQFVPLSVFMTILGIRTQDEMVKTKLTIWYWCGVFGEMYGGANDVRYINDLVVGLPWIQRKEASYTKPHLYDGSEPITVSQGFFHPERLYGLKSRSGAAYKGVMAIIAKKGAKDFITGRSMDLNETKSDNVDIHYIFPQGYCERAKLDKLKWNCVVNKTLLASQTNRMMIDKAPSEYCRYMEHDKAIERFGENVRSHVIDLAALKSDNFDLFFEKRANAILDLIGKAMDRKIGRMGDPDMVKYKPEDYDD
jgi:hypothetical protein